MQLPNTSLAQSQHRSYSISISALTSYSTSTLSPLRMEKSKPVLIHTQFSKGFKGIISEGSRKNIFRWCPEAIRVSIKLCYLWGKNLSTLMALLCSWHFKNLQLTDNGTENFLTGTSQTSEKERFLQKSQKKRTIAYLDFKLETFSICFSTWDFLSHLHKSFSSITVGNKTKCGLVQNMLDFNYNRTMC